MFDLETIRKIKINFSHKTHLSTKKSEATFIFLHKLALYLEMVWSSASGRFTNKLSDFKASKTFNGFNGLNLRVS